MFTIETFDKFEIIAYIVVGERCSLVVGQRAANAEANIIPVDIGFQRVVDERCLLVQFIDKFAR